MHTGKLLILLACLFARSAFGQGVVKKYHPDSLAGDYLSTLKKEFGVNKEYPPQFEKQILFALSHYPELKKIHICFRLRQRHASAMARSRWIGALLPAMKRPYVITFSRATEEALMPVLLENMPFNAQVGLIGHELAHIIQYSGMSALQLVKYIISNVSAKYIDRFEYHADAIGIAHGLGYQLLDWSTFIRDTMRTENWRGPDFIRRGHSTERYMNPSTIRQWMSRDSLYTPQPGQ